MGRAEFHPPGYEGSIEGVRDEIGRLMRGKKSEIIPTYSDYSKEPYQKIYKHIVARAAQKDRKLVQIPLQASQLALLQNERDTNDIPVEACIGTNRVLYSHPVSGGEASGYPIFTTRYMFFIPVYREEDQKLLQGAIEVLNDNDTGYGLVLSPVGNHTLWLGYTQGAGRVVINSSRPDPAYPSLIIMTTKHELESAVQSVFEM